MPTTEICNLTLISGSNVGDPQNEASAVLKECGGILGQQDGMQHMHFGMQVEHPETLTLLIHWDSKGKHEDFMAAESYGPFFKKFNTIFTGAPDLVHVDFKPDGGLTAALSSPVTELATFYHDGSPPADAAENAAKCYEALKGEGILGFAYGFTHETLERDGVKGKAAVAAIGWENVEAHMKARTTQAFKDNIHNLRNGAKAVEMHHVQVMNFVQ